MNNDEKIGNFINEQVLDFLHNEDELINYKGNLYHYTNVGGLLGILDSQKLWATNLLYLNDKEELKDGVELTKNILKNQINKTDDKLTIDFFNFILKYIDKKVESINIYISSLAELGDDLTQWKGYADHCSGYSIELDYKNLLQKDNRSGIDYLSLKKVVYKNEDKENLILDKLKSVLNENIDDVKKAPECIAKLVATRLVYESSRFKNEHFKEEKEWRFIYFENEIMDHKSAIEAQTNQDYSVKFRISENNMIPYFELYLKFDNTPPNKEGWILPINKITVGAKNDFNLARKSIEMIVKEKELDEIIIEKSSVPFR